MLLITGCGRSGTHFTSALLKQMGLDTPHEAIGRDGAASWKHIVSGTFVYVGKNRQAEIDASGFTRILHQVRHPLKVIASMQTFSNSTWLYMAEFIELDTKAPPIYKAMQAWVGWNDLVESKASWRFRIEDLHSCFTTFCEKAGLPKQEIPQVPHAAKDSRTERFDAVYWEDLLAINANLAERVRQMALRYGYDDIATAPPPALKLAKPASIFSILRKRLK